jgi:2-iminoacetate synthase ThiH
VFVPPPPEVRKQIELEGRNGAKPWHLAQKWQIPTREVYKLLRAAGIGAQPTTNPHRRSRRFM